MTALLSRIVDIIHHVCGLRPWPRRVAEDVRLLKTNALRKSQGVLVKFFGFAGIADDEVGRNRDIRDALTQLRNELLVKRRRIRAVHGFEDGVITRLTRQVKVGTEAWRGCVGIDDRVDHLYRLDAGQADTIDARLRCDGPEDIREHFTTAPRVRTIGADAHTGDDNLTAPGDPEITCFSHNIGERAALQNFPRVGNLAETTKVLTAILNF